MQKKKQILQRLRDDVLEYAQEDSAGKEFLSDEGFHELTATMLQTFCSVICLQAIMSKMDSEKFSVMVDKMTTIIKKMCHSYYAKKVGELNEKNL